MKPEVISFFDNFKCLAGQCPENCCKAWDMPIDRETYEKYKQAAGFAGWKLRNSMKRNQNGDPVLKTRFGKCVYLGKDKLCKLQCRGDEEYMPQVCKLFPRYTVNYGGKILGLLDLGCIQAAKVFLQNNGKLSLSEADSKMDIFWDIDAADPEFAEYMLEDWKYLTDYIYDDGGTLWEKEFTLFSHTFAQHLILVKGDIEGAKKVPIESSYLFDNFETQLPWIIKERSKELYKGLPLIPMGFINELLYQNLPDAYLLLYHPKMYKLINSYKRQYSRVLESEADRAFKGTWDDLAENYGWLEDYMKLYFSYKLLMKMPEASIDYYIIEPMLIAMVDVQFLMLFIITWCGLDKPFDEDTFAVLLSENERLLSHNPAFEAAVMQKVRDDLL